MKISKLIRELQDIKREFGDIEVTCTGSVLPDQDPKKLPCDVFETTADTLIVNEKHPVHGKAVRIWK